MAPFLCNAQEMALFSRQMIKRYHYATEHIKREIRQIVGKLTFFAKKCKKYAKKFW